MDYTFTTFLQAMRTDWLTTLPFLLLYIAATFLDVAFGFAAAFQTRQLCSTISRHGMLRKLLMMGTVLLAALFDGILPNIEGTVMGLHFKLTFGAIAALWWIIHELLSITEHAAILGLPMPARLKEALAIAEKQLDGPTTTTTTTQDPGPGGSTKTVTTTAPTPKTPQV